MAHLALGLGLDALGLVLGDERVVLELALEGVLRLLGVEQLGHRLVAQVQVLLELRLRVVRVRVRVRVRARSRARVRVRVSGSDGAVDRRDLLLAEHLLEVVREDLRLAGVGVGVGVGLVEESPRQRSREVAGGRAEH